jgi:hypothetical protein
MPMNVANPEVASPLEVSPQPAPPRATLLAPPPSSTPRTLLAYPDPFRGKILLARSPDGGSPVEELELESFDVPVVEVVRPSRPPLLSLLILATTASALLAGVLGARLAVIGLTAGLGLLFFLTWLAGRPFYVVWLRREGELVRVIFFGPRSTLTTLVAGMSSVRGAVGLDVKMAWPGLPPGAPGVERYVVRHEDFVSLLDLVRLCALGAARQSVRGQLAAPVTEVHVVLIHPRNAEKEAALAELAPRILAEAAALGTVRSLGYQWLEQSEGQIQLYAGRTISKTVP